MGSFVNKIERNTPPDRILRMKSRESVSSLPCGKPGGNMYIMYMTRNLDTTKMATETEQMSLNSTQQMTKMENTLEVMPRLLLQLYITMNLITLGWMTMAKNTTETSNSSIRSDQTPHMTQDLNMNRNPSLNKMQVLNMNMNPSLNKMHMQDLNMNMNWNPSLNKAQDLNMNMNMNPSLNKMQDLNMNLKPAMNLILMSSLKQRIGMDLSAMVSVINIQKK